MIIQTFGCHICKKSFPAKKVFTVTSPTGRTRWRCTGCEKCGVNSARAQVKSDERMRKLEAALTRKS